MKTMKMADEVRRINEGEVSEFSKKGWILCPKKIWKEKVRDKGRSKVEVKTVEKVEKKVKNSKDESWTKKDKAPRTPRNA